MAIDQIVEVTISRQTQVPTAAGFGIAAFVSADATLTEIKGYANLEEVTTDSANAGADSLAFCTAYFGQAIAPEKVYIIPDGDDTLTAALDAAIEVFNDWYVLTCASRTASDILELSGWVQARANSNPKLFFANTSDASVLDPADETDPASLAMLAAKDRTIVCYKANADEFVGAWLGLILPTNPGTTIWAFKTLAGITPDSLTSSDISTALDKKANIYQRIAGINMANNGTTAMEWIDVMRGLDWLVSEISTNLFGYMVRQPKIPFTDEGVSAVKANIQDSLSLAVDRDILAGEVKVQAPLVSSVSLANKANRVLPDVTFTGVLAGAIQKVIVKGTVTL